MNKEYDLMYEASIKKIKELQDKLDLTTKQLREAQIKLASTTCICEGANTWIKQHICPVHSKAEKKQYVVVQKPYKYGKTWTSQVVDESSTFTADDFYDAVETITKSNIKMNFQMVVHPETYDALKKAMGIADDDVSWHSEWTTTEQLELELDADS